jgi:hypothetical protein
LLLLLLFDPSQVVLSVRTLLVLAESSGIGHAAKAMSLSLAPLCGALYGTLYGLFYGPSMAPSMVLSMASSMVLSMAPLYE